MYVGAVMSTLEVIPLGFLIAYTVVLWRRGEYKTELQKTLLTFVMVAAFGAPAFWARPDIQLYVWLRLIGDVVAGAGIAVFLIYMLRALPRAIR